MPFQAAPNCVEVVIHATCAGQAMVNTFFAKSDSLPTQEEVDTIANAVDTWVGTFWLPILSQGYVYERTSVRGLSSAVDVQAEADASAGPGEVAVDPLPNNVALAIKRSSGLTGRAARGRIFVGGIPETDFEISSQTIAEAFTDAATSALDVLTGVFEGFDFSQVVLHRVSAGVPLAEAVAYTVIEWIVVDRVIDSMRRRLPGRGA